MTSSMEWNNKRSSSCHVNRLASNTLDDGGEQKTKDSRHRRQNIQHQRRCNVFASEDTLRAVASKLMRLNESFSLVAKSLFPLLLLLPPLIYLFLIWCTHCRHVQRALLIRLALLQFFVVILLRLKSKCKCFNMRKVSSNNSRGLETRLAPCATDVDLRRNRN